MSGRSRQATRSRSRRAAASRHASRRPPVAPEPRIEAPPALQRALAATWGRPLWVHAIALVVLLLALVPVMRSGAVAWVNDEIDYALQAEALRDGSWEYEPPTSEIDPEARWQPHLGEAIRADDAGRLYPHVKHPVYVVVLSSTTRLLGVTLGLAVVPIAGMLLGAVAVWLLAGRIDPRASRPAFWLFATSPLLFHSFVLWAHTVSAAVAALALLAAVRVATKGDAPAFAGLAGALAAGCLLRTEAVLFGVAVGLALGGVLAWQRRFRMAVAGLAAALVSVVVAVRIEQWLVTRWVDIAAPRNVRARADALPSAGIGDFVEGRLEGAWNLVVNPTTPTAPSWLPDLRVGVIVAVVLLVLAGLALRMRGREGAGFGVGVAALLAAAAFVLYASRFAGVGSSIPMAGLLPAWPVVTFLVAATPWRRTTTPERVLAGVVVLFVGAVLATQHELSGFADWGGRFLAPAVGAASVLLGAGLVRRMRERPLAHRVVAFTVVVAFAVYPTFEGVDLARGTRARLDRVSDAVAASGADVVVVTAVDYTGLTGWRWGDDDDTLVFAATDLDENRLLLDTLADHGVRAVTVLHDAELPRRQRSYGYTDDITPGSLVGLGLRLSRYELRET